MDGVRLGRIVYAVSSAQLTAWLGEWGLPVGPIRPLPVSDVAPQVTVSGPAPELEAEMRDLHRRSHGLSPDQTPPSRSRG
jgi:hypothetical protein